MGQLANYEDVDSRIHRFYEKHPTGRIETSIVSEAKAKGERWVVKAFVFREGEDRPAATGYAYEVDGEGNVNRTSALENCETSAIGRALANAGFSPKGQRVSRQEMEKVERAKSAEGGSQKPNTAAANSGQGEVPEPASATPSTELLDVLLNHYSANKVLSASREAALELGAEKAWVIPTTQKMLPDCSPAVFEKAAELLKEAA